MKKDLILEKIRVAAKRHERRLGDPRYLQTMGFLVSKGFLRINKRVALMPNARIRVEDAVWAGQNVEPRILEVLPAAIVRLKKHFDFRRGKHEPLGTVIDALEKRKEAGPDFMGVPYKKLRLWTELPLRDARLRSMDQKRIVKTFRLKPETIHRIKLMAHANGISDTEALERLVGGEPPEVEPT